MSGEGEDGIGKLGTIDGVVWTVATSVFDLGGRPTSPHCRRCGEQPVESDREVELVCMTLEQAWRRSSTDARVMWSAHASSTPDHLCSWRRARAAVA